ncbi:MAG: histidine kinase, partial [Phaeodactylibacter sp.]|nr:histidine kinase [Phaeodactylibacter sp.]
ENNRAWVRSGQGVFVYDPLLQQFDAYSFQDLNEGFRGMAFNLIEDTLTHTLLVAPRSTQGVFHYSLENGAWEKSEIPEDFLDDGGQFAATDAAMSPEGELTVCYKGGILRYDPETKKIRAFPVLPPIKQRHFTSLLWDSRGRLWMTTFNEGICRWDPSTQRWRVFQEEVRSDDPNLLSMSFNYLMEDSRGNIWFKREKGFGLYLTDRDTFLQVLYTLQPERCFPHINNMVEDKRGRVWMNFTDGIVGYAEAAHPENGVVRKMDLNEQPNIHIKGIWALRVDRHGDIWGWGVKALTKIDGDDISVSQYNFRYGEDDPNFYSFEILSAGELVFGGSNRIVIVHPEELRYNQEAPQPYLTGINILEESYDGSVAPLNTKELRLKHWQNFFSFDFSARGFTFGKQNQFRYRLHGFDENWILAKGRRNANYTNVPTGEYRFQLQAANNEGVWNETLFELPVAITSPWWKRWWFISALILSGSLLGYRMYLFRVRQIRKEEKLKAEFEKRLADVEMSALRAQMNPHFLFNSLNSIDSFIIRNETQKASEYLNNFARLIRLILQNSRSNYVSLKDEVEAIELYLQMENLRFRDKFTYEVRIDECIELSSIDIPPMLIQPYIENAIWHGLMHKEDKSQGKVTFSVAKENGFLQCVIEDNGIGREQAKELNARRPLRGRQSYGMR